jgi:hypothetical protein
LNEKVHYVLVLIWLANCRQVPPTAAITVKLPPIQNMITANSGGTVTPLPPTAANHALVSHIFRYLIAF